MIRPHLGDAASRLFWLLLAGAAGLVLAIVPADGERAARIGVGTRSAERARTRSRNPSTAPVQQVDRPDHERGRPGDEAA